MSQFTIVCPHCRQRFACPEQFRGRKVKCPLCETVVVVPATAAKGVNTASATPAVGTKAPGSAPNPDKKAGTEAGAANARAGVNEAGWDRFVNDAVAGPPGAPEAPWRKRRTSKRARTTHPAKAKGPAQR